MHSNPLQQRHRSQTPIRTNTDDGLLSRTHRRQFLRRLTQYPRAGRAEGMADGDAAAIGIQSLPGELAERVIHTGFFAQEVFAFQCSDVAKQLRSEGFVDFPEIDVGEREAVPRVQARDRVGGRHEQPLGENIDAGDFVIQ